MVLAVKAEPKRIKETDHGRLASDGQVRFSEGKPRDWKMKSMPCAAFEVVRAASERARGCSHVLVPAWPDEAAASGAGLSVTGLEAIENV